MDQERRYREEQIQDLLWKMYSDYSELTMLWEYVTEKDKESSDYLEKQDCFQTKFEEHSKAVYLLIVAYLEGLGYKDYLSNFKRVIEPILKDREELLRHEFIEETSEMVSKTGRLIWSFLLPFEFSQGSYLDKLLQNKGLVYLERILRNTQVIINETKCTPKSEMQVYQAVKFVVKSVYPSAVNPQSGFFKSFKNYNPDILVPELHVAVEYKYADTEAKLKNQVDQISADVNGYTGDSNYELFYAVFYVTKDFWGIDKFEHAWKEMKFQKNWKGIYVIGK